MQTLEKTPERHIESPERRYERERRHGMNYNMTNQRHAIVFLTDKARSLLPTSYGGEEKERKKNTKKNKIHKNGMKMERKGRRGESDNDHVPRK